MLNLTFRNGNTPALNASNLNAIVNAVNANETALGGKADASHTHAASDISSGVLPINRGGTGQTTAKAAATSLLTSLSNGDTAMQDETLVVTSKYNGLTDVWYKRPASLLWNYIKAKADGRYPTLLDGTVITSSADNPADLNDATFRVPGTYNCRQAAIAATVKHTPYYNTTTLVNTDMLAFVLRVSYGVGTNQSISQELRTLNDGCVYYRYLQVSSGIWTAWDIVSGTASALNQRLTVSTANAQDAMYFATTAATGETGKWYKRPASAIWNYIKTKAATELYITAGWNGDSVLGDYATAEGRQNTAAGDYSHAEGYGTKSDGWGYGAHAEGINTYAFGYFTHAEGVNTRANGEQPGVSSIQDLGGAHAEGFGTTANDEQSHAEGKNTVTFGIAAHAEGIGSSTTNEAAHAEGMDTIAAGQGSHAEGYKCQANGNFSHAEGMYTIASGPVQHVFGQYNKSDTTNVEIVGWGTGTADSNRKNIRTLATNGNMTIAGTLTQSSDARLKDVAGEIPDVSSIRAVRFKWNDTNGEHDDKDHIGYIAQEVEQLAPFLVGDDSNGYKSLDYIALLCAKVEMLERRVKELEEKKG